MSRWNPCKRSEFVKKLKRLGFEGLYSGGKHQFMIYGQRRLTIPSNNEYSVPQVRFMIREIELIIERHLEADEWNAL